MSEINKTLTTFKTEYQVKVYSDNTKAYHDINSMPMAFPTEQKAVEYMDFLIPYFERGEYDKFLLQGRLVDMYEGRILYSKMKLCVVRFITNIELVKETSINPSPKHPKKT